MFPVNERASAISIRLERVVIAAETFERSVFGGVRSQHRFAYALRDCQRLFCWKIALSIPVFFWNIHVIIPQTVLEYVATASKIILEYLTRVSNFFPAIKYVVVTRFIHYAWTTLALIPSRERAALSTRRASAERD